MRTARRNKTALILVIVILAALAAALVIGLLSKKEPEDPHKGQVYIYDGFDWIWMTPLEGVPANELTEEFFSSSSGRIEYTGSDYDVLRGVDVSEHQLDIDWKQVAASGVDYAYIRVGWRGYTEGGLFEDAYFERNIQSALDAGLHVGVYMKRSRRRILSLSASGNITLRCRSYLTGRRLKRPKRGATGLRWNCGQTVRVLSARRSRAPVMCPAYTLTGTSAIMAMTSRG